MSDDFDGTETPPADSEPLVLIRAQAGLETLADEIRTNWTGSLPTSVRRACEDVVLADSFARAADSVPDDIKHDLWKDAAYLGAFEELRTTAGYMRSLLQVVDRRGGRRRDGSARVLAEHATSLRASLHEAVAAFAQVVEHNTTAPDTDEARKLAERYLGDIWALQGHDMVDAERAANQTLGKILDLHSQAQQATADIGAGTVGEHYEKYAHREARIADLLRLIVGGIVVVIVLQAVFFNRAVTEATLTVELVRLSSAIPLAALAAYLARESTRHREAARWGRERAIAMQTMPAYTAEFEEDDRRVLWQVLGIRVFGLTPDGNTVAPEPSLPEELLGTVQKVTDGLRNLGDTLNSLRGPPERPAGKPDPPAAR